MGIEKKRVGSLLPINNRSETVKLRIRFPSGRVAVIDGNISPLHGDWLWDLFEIPPGQRKEELELELPASALKPYPPK